MSITTNAPDLPSGASTNVFRPVTRPFRFTVVTIVNSWSTSLITVDVGCFDETGYSLPSSR